MHKNTKIVVAIPCYNEALCIARVVEDFRKQLPQADIVVFDNGSTDSSDRVAEQAGARVIREKRPGKGWVVQSIFEKLDADIYIIVDGDSTYDAMEVHHLIKPVLEEKADMVVGTRLEKCTSKTLRPLHQLGNFLITKTINFVFNTRFQDVLSGYRVVSREFAKNIPLVTTGFEIETELTLQALEKGFIIKEIPVCYHSRPEGSYSKLRTFGDGYRILLTIAILLRDHRPLVFFSTGSLVTIVTAFLLWFFSRDQSSPWIRMSIPTLVIVAFIFLSTGFVLNAVSTRFKELTSLFKKNIYFTHKDRS